MRSKNILSKPFIICILALICTFLWGSAFPAIKTGYNLFHIESSDTWSQVLFAGYRFTLAGILTVIIGSIIGKKILLPHTSSVPKIIIVSIFQTILQYIFFYCGLARTSGVKASIIDGSSTFFAILISCLIFRYEKLTLNKIIGCILGFIGVILVNITPGTVDMSISFTGEGFILISTIAYAASSSLIKCFSKAENPVMISGYQFIFGGICMIILAKLLGGSISYINTSGILMLVYLAMVSAIAYSLWGLLLKYNPVSKVTIYGFTIPVFGAALSAIFLAENGQLMGIYAIASLILVCIGILMVNKPQEKVN